MNTIDIFPAVFSKTVSRLRHYPDFEDWIENPHLEAFITHADARCRVKYLQIATTDKHLQNLSKDCKYFNRIAYEKRKIDFNRCANRLWKNPHQSEKSNLGFKLNNIYLVKPYFTFGLRRVHAGSYHIIQTTRVPLIVYICPKPMMFRHEEGVFPRRDLKHYDRKLLSPMGKFRIPPGNEYVLLTVQKTLFRLDVVSKELQLPFKHRDLVEDEPDELRDFLLVEMFKPDFEKTLDNFMDLENLNDLNELFMYIDNPV